MVTYHLKHGTLQVGYYLLTIVTFQNADCFYHEYDYKLTI